VHDHEEIVSMAPSRAPRAWLPPLPWLSTLVLSVAIGGAVAQAVDPVASLPGGPKNLLAELTDDPALLREIAGSERTAEAWTAYLAGLGQAMTEDQLAMLAEYLSLNTPAQADGDDIGAMVSSLPPDGRELFATGCSSCHGVVSYYLLQDRDAAGWMDIFVAPYHRRLLTGDNERETFAGYAARAMPIPENQVPPAWKQ
jgi:hypothetical protein